ncbi:MAG: aminoglycoside phosphotransferase family protein [Clostridium sp.]|nr:aminoglycoside phosphotransferase family protein [Acetatifactor muris]MCM1527923.1 aminoglycoside phosphotransferase family protein [Bacteroides sp.]MCM1564012.1 aminoglycoside phosphotransferase family protein [Clostridium sp.]
MKTATKNTFTDEEITTVIKRHFPDDTVTEIIPLNGGTFNTLYRINGNGTLANGIILKTGPCGNVKLPDHEKKILQTEVYTYQLLNGHNIPIPKIYGYDFSKTDIPCDYFIMERMHGKTWFEYWPIRDPELMRALGKYTARMHSVEPVRFGEISDDPAKRFDTWGAAFTAMTDNVLEEIRAQNLLLPFDKIRYAVESRRAMLDALQKPSLVNIDLWAGNVFVRKQEEGYQLTGIIDFERCFSGDPLASFSTALLLYDNVEKETAFLEGYNNASPKPLRITNEDREKMLLYEMLMYLRSYAETSRYGFWFRTAQRMAIRDFVHSILSDLSRMERIRLKKRNGQKSDKIEISGLKT